MRKYDAKLVEKAINTIRMLSVDGVEKANSGHPGTPMALAQIAFEIWTRHLRYDPTAPTWADRDRFILSCGHASMLLYSLLHLAGYDLPLDELKRFRQWNSRTPGHPESHITQGVEITTGPLGQGIANAVGIAAGIKMLGARFNAHGPISTGRVFGLASDGDLMEGVSGEASSLAGHLGLDNLIFFYDDNHITIDGNTSLAFSEDVGRRYEAYGWFVQHIDGHDHAQIQEALDRAVDEKERPSLIVARTHIGIGSPKQDTAKAHGEALGAKDVAATKKALGWPEDQTFLVPDEVRALFAERAEDGKKARAAWEQAVTSFSQRGGEAYDLYRKITTRELPDDLFEELVKAAPAKDGATRAQSGVIEQRAAALVPSLVGGSADLNPSTKTYIEGSEALRKGHFEGRNIHFGIREHAMGAFVNGLAAGLGFIPFGSTFLVFSDYMRPPIRLAALSHLQSIFVFTHDSVYLGEDGPTHQPVEHYWALRLIPRVDFVRPADALECAMAWTHALRRKDGPTVLALSRQKLANLPRPEGFDNKLMLRGAYVLADAEGEPSIVIIATGSEVEVALGVKAILDAEGERIRVVSAPCWEEFERQEAVYRDAVLTANVKRVSIEIGVTAPWRGIVGPTGLAIGWDAFGASAPDSVIQKEFGFTKEAVADKIRAWRRGQAST
jgi:transketolase